MLHTNQRTLLLTALVFYALVWQPCGRSQTTAAGMAAPMLTQIPLAQIVAKHFGWKAAVPAYILAGFTGIARMEDRRHYLSDVFFGAAIGLTAGDAVAGGRGASHLFDYLSIGLNSVGLS